MSAPFYSKRKVDEAGYTLLNPDCDEEALQHAKDVVDYWRAIHLEPLQVVMDATFAVMPSASFPIAGRIKKYSTIIDKLQRGSTPNSLKSTYDIAGCRVVVPDLTTQQEYCRLFEQTSGIVDATKTQKRNYLKIPHPSGSGYRSRHIICKLPDLQCGHELFVELQVRTQLQHAWSTAAELYDKIQGTRLKFNEMTGAGGMFFIKAAELIKQLEETGDVNPRTIRDMAAKPDESKVAVHVLDALKAASLSPLIIRDVSKDLPDCFLVDFVAEEQIVFVTGTDLDHAIDDYREHESRDYHFPPSAGTHDTVLVRGGSVEHLQVLYPNYFGNISSFTGLIEKFWDAFV